MKYHYVDLPTSLLTTMLCFPFTRGQSHQTHHRKSTEHTALATTKQKSTKYQHVPPWVGPQDPPRKSPQGPPKPHPMTLQENLLCFRSLLGTPRRDPQGPQRDTQGTTKDRKGFPKEAQGPQRDRRASPKTT